MAFADDVSSRIGPLFPADDPRIEWLPDAPSAAEVHVRADAKCDLVVGYTGERFGEVEEFVQRCLVNGVERGGADHRDAWNRWVNTSGLDVLDAGAQLAPTTDRLQVYLRGHFSPTAVVEAFAAVGLEASERLVANSLALFSIPDIEMIGLELDKERISAALYLPIQNRNAKDAEAINDAVEFLLSALLRKSPAADQWGTIAKPLLMTPVEEFIYVSYEPRYDARWVKVDVTRRPLALAGTTAATLGVDVDAMMAAATANALDPLSHLGVRFGAELPDVSIYHSLI